MIQFLFLQLVLALNECLVTCILSLVKYLTTSKAKKKNLMTFTNFISLILSQNYFLVISNDFINKILTDSIARTSLRGAVEDYVKTRQRENWRPRRKLEDVSRTLFQQNNIAVRRCFQLEISQRSLDIGPTCRGATPSAINST